MPTRRRLRLLWRRAGLVALAALVVAALAAHEVAINRRLAVLEAAVAARDKADPLMPVECSVDYIRGSGGGETREKPCNVEFERLIEAPQQFEGRWVRVRGIYAGGFETSSLTAVDQPWSDSKNGIPPPPDGYRHALWVAAPHPGSPGDPSGPVVDEKATIVGRFHRGPSGHLDAYFGRLEDH